MKHQQAHHGFRLASMVALVLMISPCLTGAALAKVAGEQVCDIGADYALGMEDYPQAIRLHLAVLRKHPNNALAHYHLGFAEGMLGDRKAEIEEYQRAEALGLKNWDLFLNIGLAQFEAGDVNRAVDSFRTAVLLGPQHYEAHFNLALAEVQRGMLPDAEQQTISALRLSPGEPEARNLLGAIYAQEGNTARASQVWHQLAQDTPEYEPAVANLRILSHSSDVDTRPSPIVSRTEYRDDNDIQPKFKLIAGETPSSHKTEQ
jgi:tetratricopeptide (TPR) repeat protein